MWNSDEGVEVFTTLEDALGYVEFQESLDIEDEEL